MWNTLIRCVTQACICMGYLVNNITDVPNQANNMISESESCEENKICYNAERCLMDN